MYPAEATRPDATDLMTSLVTGTGRAMRSRDPAVDRPMAVWLSLVFVCPMLIRVGTYMFSRLCPGRSRLTSPRGGYHST